MHETWKVSESHEVFWELWPVVDHVVPVTRHGSNDPSNLVTTSVTNNVAKGTALLTELGWSLLPPPANAAWDGLLGVFRELVSRNAGLLENSQLRGWHKAAGASAA